MRTLAFIALIAVTGPAFGQAPVHAMDPWVRAMPPGMSMTAGYFTLHAALTGTVTLVEVHSEWFERVEIHTSGQAGGVARMQAVERVEVPAGEMVEFRPGGLHLMLIGAKQPFEEGEKVPLTLVFDNGWTLEVEAPVRRAAPADRHRHHH